MLKLVQVGCFSIVYCTCDDIIPMNVLDSIGVQLWPTSRGVALTLLKRIEHGSDTILISKYAMLESNEKKVQKDATTTSKSTMQQTMLSVDANAIQSLQIRLPVELKDGFVRILELLPRGTPFVHISVNNIGYVVTNTHGIPIITIRNRPARTYIHTHTHTTSYVLYTTSQYSKYNVCTHRDAYLTTAAAC